MYRRRVNKYDDRIRTVQLNVTFCRHCFCTNIYYAGECIKKKAGRTYKFISSKTHYSSKKD